MAVNMSKTRFLFSMSHDIRTPMNAITGFSMMARKYADSKEKVLDYLKKIDVSSRQLLTLINQVLEMSRIESGRIEFNEQPVNVKDRFGSIVLVMSDQAAAAGLEFHSSLEGITHPFVYADDARIGQIILNITGNAIKYTPEGGSVDFTIREAEPRKEGFATYVLTVSDTGIGMSEEFLKSIYEPFSRERTSTVSRIQGTGLGMSIVKSLVDLAGGEIAVNSEPGKGTRFEVTLDLRIAESMPFNPDGEPGAKNLSFRLSGKRALLVEDNEMNREIAKFILEEKGVTIDEAEDGDIAVEKIMALAEEGRLNHYDFIMMDIQMPRMNGYEATGRIREITDPLGVHIPIIALSANAFEEDRKKSHEAGMDDHVAKPIDVNQMVAVLAKHL